MFDDFGQTSTNKEGRGRRSLSAVLSLAVFGVLALGVGGAIAAHQVQKKRAEKDLDISFDDLPQVKAPKPKPAVRAPAPVSRKSTARKPVVAPRNIPKDKPAEAEGDLADSEESGPIDGLTEGSSGPAVTKALQPEAAPPPQPPPPPSPPPAPSQQQRDSIAAPRFLSGCRSPQIPQALHKSAATIQIDVRMLIGSDGRVSSAKVVQSHPLIPDQLILECVRAQVFEPAHLPDGTAVPYPFKRRFMFRPA
jgi:periplasmic protein TonB